MTKDSVIFNLSDRRFPKGEIIDYPDSITDQFCLSVAQQVERFGIGCGNLPISEYYDSDETCMSDDTVVSPYGLSDPVDVKIRQNAVDAVVDAYKVKSAKGNEVISKVTKTKVDEVNAVEGSGDNPQ